MKNVQDILDKMTEKVLQIQGEENLPLIEGMLKDIKEIEGGLYQIVYKTQSQLVDIFSSLEMHDIIDLEEQEVIEC